LIERGTRDTDGARHSAKLAWRALALLQIEIEKDTAAEKRRKLEQHIDSRDIGHQKTPEPPLEASDLELNHLV
jgi:hypothetical protein